MLIASVSCLRLRVICMRLRSPVMPQGSLPDAAREVVLFFTPSFQLSPKPFIRDSILRSVRSVFVHNAVVPVTFREVFSRKCLFA